MRRSFAASLAVFCLIAAPALAAPPAAPGAPAIAQAAAGQTVFAQCKSCHSLEAGKTMTGPSLKGLFGRKSGTLAGYTFSPAMKAYGKTWDEVSLNAYLEAPLKTVKGTKMAFAGVKDPVKRAALIAYLKTATK